ncbi:glycosyltransferase [Grimontia kaedaensis]|uniref:Glycosyltransferase n=1 Tax=Grimontia kaedaensis TaxID=2872157 RepID=A0ABY4WUK9_9GAMM|nr:glycosyltransferase [Grimontia kaedaensis]USH03263.1 glycosyltransferase [Grimontia kaedaensis]
MKKPKLTIVVDDSILEHHHGVRRYLLSFSHRLKSLYEIEVFRVQFGDFGECFYSKLKFDYDYSVNNGFNESYKLDSLEHKVLVDFLFNSKRDSESQRDYFSFTALYYGATLPNSDICIVGSPWILCRLESEISADKKYCIGYDAIPNTYSMDDVSDSALYNFAREHFLGYEKANVRYDGILAISEAAKQQITSLGIEPSKVFVIPPFLPLGFQSIETKERKNNTLILAAPFDDRKGFKRIPKLINETDVERVIIFGGVRCNKESVLEFFKELSCKSVEWWPKVTTEDQIRLYNSANLLIFPSYSEGLGLPVIEALSCGTNVLVSDIEPLNKLVCKDSILPMDKKKCTLLINESISLVNVEENKDYAHSNWGKEKFASRMHNIFDR